MTIEFRNCTSEVSEELNTIINTVSRAVAQHYDTGGGEEGFTLFMGHRQYHLLRTVTPGDAYALRGEKFMGCAIVRVTQGRYLKVVANTNLFGG